MTELNPQTKLACHFLQRSDITWNSPPVQVEISPTNFCNAKCPWCFYSIDKYKPLHSNREINYKSLAYSIAEMAEMGVKAITWTGGGEPSLYSKINEIIQVTNNLGLKQGMFTNAYKPLQNPELLEWIRISITERYQITKHVKEYSKRTKVGVNFNVSNYNQDKIKALIEEAIQSNVQYFQIRPALADRCDLQEEIEFPHWIVDYQNQIRIETTDYKWKDYLKAPQYSICNGHLFVPFIWHNGDLNVCAYHFDDPRYKFGNIEQQSFKNIWNSDKRKKMLESGIPVIFECQHCCKLHEINKILSDIIEIENVDFI